MFQYFNVRPKSISTSSFPVEGAGYQGSPTRTFVKHSVAVRQAILENRELEVGALITPEYDSEETIKSGMVNPFSSPNMSSFDRFEYAREAGLDVVTSQQVSANSDPLPSKPAVDSTPVVDSSVETS